MMLKYFRIDNAKLGECPDKAQAQVILSIAPDAAEFADIIQNYKIDEHDLHSSLDFNELSRFEFEDDYTILIIKRPKNYSSTDNMLFKVNAMGIFLLKDGRILIVMAEDIQIVEGKHFSKVKTPLDVLIRIIYGTISHFIGHLRVINSVSEELEQKINASMENKYLINMFSLEKSLVYYLDGINSNAKVIDKLKATAARIGFTAENTDMLEDIIIENQQCQKQAEIYLNILTGLMDARGSIVNNNLNILIKRLTIINIVFMPLNLLAGIGGMSEYSMMTRNIAWPIAYAAFLVAMVIFGIMTYSLMTRIGQKSI
jgi:magnesium transporter